jgi:hypothetical protein
MRGLVRYETIRIFSLGDTCEATGRHARRRLVQEVIE